MQPFSQLPSCAEPRSLHPMIATMKAWTPQGQESPSIGTVVSLGKYILEIHIPGLYLIQLCGYYGLDLKCAPQSYVFGR